MPQKVLVDDFLGLRGLGEVQLVSGWREGVGQGVDQLAEGCEVVADRRRDRLLDTVVARDDGGVGGTQVCCGVLRQRSAPAFQPVLGDAGGQGGGGLGCQSGEGAEGQGEIRLRSGHVLKQTGCEARRFLG